MNTNTILNGFYGTFFFISLTWELSVLFFTKKIIKLMSFSTLPFKERIKVPGFAPVLILNLLYTTLILIGCFINLFQFALLFVIAFLYVFFNYRKNLSNKAMIKGLQLDSVISIFIIIMIFVKIYIKK